MRREFPKLYAVSSNGKIKEWEIWVEEENDIVNIVNQHGYEDGKKQLLKKQIDSGKNIGKANETSIFEQACSEAESKWNSKIDSKYITSRPSKTNKSEIILPMLALSFSKRSHNIKFPCFVQPKYNGVRCLALKTGNDVVYQSRRGKLFETLTHFDDIIKQIPEDIRLDGEVYVHNEPFQNIVSWVKKDRGEETKKLEYWVYDIAVENMTFSERYKKLESLFSEILRSPIQLVPTYVCENIKQVKEFHDEFVKLGYEGVMIRNSHGMYKFDHRSQDLQKYKEFIDEEFEITGGKSGTGLYEGCVVFECKTPENKTFECVPKGTLEYKRELFKNLSNLVGKQLTVRYFEKSLDNIPIFPVGVAIRDYE